jgi:NAD(P)-dependent dehydrogenase (short-subunit alcohol dehydrogenase family)
MSKKLSGKIAVVTGGSAGIGLGVAKRFAEEGAYVFVTGRRQAELDKAVAAIGGNSVAIQGDASKLADLDRIYAVVKEKAGKIDVLSANAGFYAFGTFGEITEKHFDTIFDTNVRGLLFTVQKALPLMSRGSSVIMTGSIAGSIGIPSMSVYSASKAAVRAFARSWVLDLKERGIRINVLSPGHTATPGLDGLLDEGKQAEIAATIPLQRLGTPGDLGNAAVFLASDDSAYVTGIELAVDGGAAQH